MRRLIRKSLRASLVTAAVLAVPAAPLAAQGSAYEQLQTFSGVLSQIRANYVDSVTTEHLVRAAIEGMLRSLDPHSYFLPHAINDRLMAWRAGELAGTGIILEEVEGAITVQAVLSRSPAADAGVLPGDRVVSINDTVVAGVSVQALQARLIGERGSRVRLLLERGSLLEPQSVEVRVRNELLRPQSVSMAQQLAPGVGYVRLEEFQEHAGRELHDAVSRVTRGPQPHRLILDLRGNPGGVVQAAVDVASEFLRNGQVVFRTRGRRRDVDQEFRTARDGSFDDVTLVVLVDAGTASAAEALAGSLQDHDRAVILGRRSFGKALMQRLFLVPPASDAVWLTIGYVLTPGGRLIQRRYRGLDVQQYYALAGRGGAAEDTVQEYRTDGGRLVRGGGGIVPDSALPGPALLPVWWSVAADSGFDHAVADSVAQTLGTDQRARDAWLDAPVEWRTKLVAPFLERVRSRLEISAEPDSAVAARLARILAARATEVRWGTDAAEAFWVRHDPDIRAALEILPRVTAMLRPRTP